MNLTREIGPRMSINPDQEVICTHCDSWHPAKEMIFANVEGKGVSFEPQLVVKELGLFGGAADLQCFECYNAMKEPDKIVEYMENDIVVHHSLAAGEDLERLYFVQEDAPICGYCRKGLEEGNSLIHTVHSLDDVQYHLRIHQKCITDLRSRDLVLDVEDGSRLYKMWESLHKKVEELFDVEV